MIPSIDDLRRLGVAHDRVDDALANLASIARQSGANAPKDKQDRLLVALLALNYAQANMNNEVAQVMAKARALTEKGSIHA